jgi:hypothetical protein
MPTIVTPPAVIKVQVGTGTNPKATTISYGAGRTIKGSSDLNMSGAINNDVIVYKVATDSFVVETAQATVTIVDNGFF